MFRTYAGLTFMLLGLPLLIGTMLFAPGLIGLLDILGLGALVPAATAILAGGVLCLLAAEALNARGTYHVREHVQDMAGWAVVFVFLIALASALRT